MNHGRGRVYMRMESQSHTCAFCHGHATASLGADLVQKVGALEALGSPLQLTYRLTDIYRHTEVIDVFAHKVLDKGPNIQFLGRLCWLW